MHTPANYQYTFAILVNNSYGRMLEEHPLYWTDVEIALQMRLVKKPSRWKGSYMDQVAGVSENSTAFSPVLYG